MADRPAPAPLSAAQSALRGMLRWFVLCAVVGVGAGALGAAFVLAVHAVQELVLGWGLGVELTPPPGEAHWRRNQGEAHLHLYFLPLVVAAGGLVVGLLGRWLGPAVAGGGTNTFLAAYHQRGGKLPWHLPLSKWVASVVTLGTGGSGGREGPASLMGAALGSAFAGLWRLGPRERRLLMLAGAAAAVGAVFRIPLGAAIFAIEVLYRDGFEEEGVFPCLIASVSGYSVFATLVDTGSLFTTSGAYAWDARSLPLYVLVGVAVTPFGYLFAAALGWVPRFFDSLGWPRWLRPAVGGLIVGSLGLVNYELLGSSYGWVQAMLTPEPQPVTLVVVLTPLALALVKIGVTGVTVGSGGSAGTFGPTVVVGVLVGGAAGFALRALWPELGSDPSSFALVGMGALLGGLGKTPMAAVIIVCELTGNYALLVPLMLAVGVAYLLLRRATLYPAQLPSHSHSPVHAGRLARGALDTMRVEELGPLRAAPPAVPETMRLPQLVALLAARPGAVFPVTDEHGAVRYMVHLKSVASVLDESTFWAALVAHDAALPLVVVSPADSVREALKRLSESGLEELLVRDQHGAFVGVVGYQDVARFSAEEGAT